MLFKSAVLDWSLALMRTPNETRSTRTIPQLMNIVASGRLDPTVFATHHVALDDTMSAYDTFADAANTGALKIVLGGAESDRSSEALVGATSAG
ncbi:MAG TPA: hypothetical protein VIJ50_14725 [Solirubrobacteraceae bacterium]